MRVATYNVNSIRLRLDSVLAWMARHKPDIVCVQETKVQDADFPEAPIREAGYHVAYRGQKAYNGVAILSTTPPEDVRTGLDDGGPADETRLIRARFGEVTVVNTYVPQGREVDHEMFQYKLQWLRRLREFMDRHFSTRDAVIWAGDLNVAIQPIDVYNPEERARHVCYHADARSALQYCLDWGFKDVFRAFHPEAGHYTFFDYRTADSVDRGWGWRIDYILASPPLTARARDAFIDVEPRRLPKASDHTYLVADFQ